MHRLKNTLLALVWAILVLTACMKLLSLHGSLPWNGSEPLTGLNIRTVLLWSSLAELGVCAGIILLRGIWKGWIVTMTGLQFTLYHWALWRIGYHGHCPCFGRFYKTLGGDWHVTFYFALGILAAGLTVMVLSWLEARSGNERS